MSALIDFNTINMSDIQFSEPKTNSLGGQSVYVSYNGNKIITQIPKTKCPFGLNSQSFDNSPVKYTLDVSLGKGEGKIAGWRQFVYDLDKHIIDTAVEKSETWFKKKKSAGVIEELYKPIVVESKKDYPATMKLKLPFYNNEFQTIVFDSKRNKVEPSLIEKGCEVTLIAELAGMWFVGKQFGVSWKIIQAKVYPLMKMDQYAFVDEEDGEEEEVEIEEEEEVEPDAEEEEEVETEEEA